MQITNELKLFHSLIEKTALAAHKLTQRFKIKWIYLFSKYMDTISWQVCFGFRRKIIYILADWKERAKTMASTWRYNEIEWMAFKCKDSQLINIE